MTTENTTQEVTLTSAQKAEDFFKSHSSTEIIETLTRCYEQEQSFRNTIEMAEKARADFRTRWASMSDTIEKFLKVHISEGDSASVEELKELADDLDIELTKSIKVTFTIEVTAEMDVDIDFDEENIDDSDFDIDITYNGDTDAEVEWDVNDFDVEVDS